MLCYILDARNNYYYQLNFTERFNHEFKWVWLFKWLKGQLFDSASLPDSKTGISIHAYKLQIRFLL